MLQAKQEDEQEQIEALEMSLLVPDILLFRHLAGRALKRQTSAQGSSSSLRSETSNASSKRASLDLSAAEEAAKDPGSSLEGSSKDQLKESDSPNASGTRYNQGINWYHICPSCNTTELLSPGAAFDTVPAGQGSIPTCCLLLTIADQLGAECIYSE